MGYRTGPGLAAVLISSAVFATLLAGCNKSAGPPTNSITAKPGCIGCSSDGTTTPRISDGRPDLNGFWSGAAPKPTGGRGAGNAAPAAGTTANQAAAPNQPRGANAGWRGNPAGFGFVGGVMQRYPDGSIVYDPSTEYNAENGAGRICQSDDCQAPNQPPYNAEWMVKVREIAKTEFGGTTPLDPVQSCRPLGVPRAGINGIYVVQTPQLVALLYEGAPYSTYRLIFTDGRQHPDGDKLEPSFWGHSTGKWDGDTLVVDVAGLTEDSWVG